MSWLRDWLDNEGHRRAWVRAKLEALPAGALLLDAGCGSQQYRPFCAHLRYEAQDFGQVGLDAVDSFAARPASYTYGPLDYTGDIWAIPVAEGRFDAVLCTEVLEHVPYPARTLNELGRVAKPGGWLLLTVPAHSLRHMDPHWYFPGFSDRWLTRLVGEAGFDIEELVRVGDYHSWMRTEAARGMKLRPWAAPFLLPAFAYHALAAAAPTPASAASMCEGYYVSARRRSAAGAAHD